MRYRRWLIVGLICLAVGALFAYIAHPPKKVRRSSPNKVAQPKDTTHVNVKDATLSLLDAKSNIRWELKIVNVQEDDQGMKLATVSGWYFPEKGKAFALVATNGKISKDMSRMTLEGGVRLSQPGYLLQGNKLVWASNAKGFQMLGGIRVESQDMRGIGETLFADSSLKHVRFEGQSRWETISTRTGRAKP